MLVVATSGISGSPFLSTAWNSGGRPLFPSVLYMALCFIPCILAFICATTTLRRRTNLLGTRTGLTMQSIVQEYAALLVVFLRAQAMQAKM